MSGSSERLSPACVQNVFVLYNYYPKVETDLLQIGGLALSSVCSQDPLEFRAYLDFRHMFPLSAM